MQRYANNFVVVPAAKSEINEGCHIVPALTKEEVIKEYLRWEDSFHHRQNHEVSLDLVMLHSLPDLFYFTAIRQYTGHRSYRKTLISGNGGPKSATFISSLRKW